MMKLVDSGNRVEFTSGAVRDIQTGKGRCDLLPLSVISKLFDTDVQNILDAIDNYMQCGNINYLIDAVRIFISYQYGDICTGVLALAKHFELGALKYGEHNWEKGIPMHCYINSGIRHLMKHIRGDTDEPHDNAFVWNIVCAIWTHTHKPDLIDLAFNRSTNVPDTISAETSSKA